jgi:hypothetical protein
MYSIANGHPLKRDRGGGLGLEQPLIVGVMGLRLQRVPEEDEAL